MRGAEAGGLAKICQKCLIFLKLSDWCSNVYIGISHCGVLNSPLMFAQFASTCLM